MAQSNNSTQSNPLSRGKRMIVGAVIGLFVVSFFLIGGKADPAWGRFWMIRPLIVVPFAGALGGLCNDLIFGFQRRTGSNKILALILSVIVFFIGLWISLILGFAGTHWD